MSFQFKVKKITSHLIHNFWLAIGTLTCYCFTNPLISQTATDSLNQIRLDSISRIPLIIKSFRADEIGLKTVVDSNSTLLPSVEQQGIHLNNYYSPQFHVSNFKDNHRIYDHGINSLNFLWSGFDDYTFIQPTKPYAEISIHRGRAFSNSQAGFSDNFDLHLIFAENFRNRLLWNFSYDKESYLGIYENGRQKNTLFKTGVQYSGKQDKFHLNVVFIDQRHRILNNWGITSDSILTDPNYSVRESSPVNINSAFTNTDEKSIGFNIDFPILNQSEKLKPLLYLKSFFTDYSFNYNDPKANSSQAIYKTFWVDSFVIEHKLYQRIWTNSIGFKLFNTNTIDANLGARYEHVIYDHDTLESKIDVFQLEAGGIYRINENLVLDGSIRLIQFKANYAPDLEFNFKLLNSKYADLKLKAFHNAEPIPYVYRYLVLNKSYHWQNQFDHEFIKESGLAITINAPRISNAELGMSWSNYSNFIYLDTLSYPVTASQIDKINMHCNLPITFNRLKFNSQFNYEVFSPDPGHFSGWNSSHQLSANLSIFKKVVNAEIGATLKLYDYKHKFNFNPIIQLFHASEVPNELIYSVGMFMHFKVSDFQLLIDVDNLDSFWLKERPSLVNAYPFYDFFFKFGLNWKFLN